MNLLNLCLVSKTTIKMIYAVFWLTLLVFYTNTSCKMSSLMGGLVWFLNNNKKYDHKVKAHHCGCTANLCRNMWAYRDIRIYPQGLKNFREKVKRLPRRDRDTNQPKRGNFQPFSPQQHGGSLPQYPYQSHFLCVFFPPFYAPLTNFLFFWCHLERACLQS